MTTASIWKILRKKNDNYPLASMHHKLPMKFSQNFDTFHICVHTIPIYIYITNMWLIDVIHLNPYLILIISILYFPQGTLYLRQLNMLCNVWRTTKLQRLWDVLFYKLYIYIANGYERLWAHMCTMQEQGLYVRRMRTLVINVWFMLISSTV